LGCGQEEDHAAFQTDGYVKQACDDLSAKAFKIIIFIILHIVRTPRAVPLLPLSRTMY